MADGRRFKNKKCDISKTIWPILFRRNLHADAYWHFGL